MKWLSKIAGKVFRYFYGPKGIVNTQIDPLNKGDSSINSYIEDHLCGIVPVRGARWAFTLSRLGWRTKILGIFGARAMNIDLSNADAATNVKLRNIILYILKQSVEDVRCGVTKLNKLVLYVDFINYARAKKPVTGGTYFKNRYGPTLRGIDAAFAAMIDDGDIVPDEREYKNKKQVFYIAKRSPKSGVLTDGDCALADEVIDKFWMLDGTDISNKSKADFGLREFKNGQDVPYYLAVIRPHSATAEDIEWIKENGLVADAETWHDHQRSV